MEKYLIENSPKCSGISKLPKNYNIDGKFKFLDYKTIFSKKTLDDKQYLLLSKINIFNSDIKKFQSFYKGIALTWSSETTDEILQAINIETKQKFVLNGFSKIIFPNQKIFDNVFLINYINYSTNLKKFKISLPCTTRCNMNNEYLNNLKLFIPLLCEQTKIANFLSLLDKQIDLYVRKLKLMEEKKKYYLYNMISKQNNPTLRFFNFKNNYKKINIGNVIELNPKSKIAVNMAKNNIVNLFPFYTSGSNSFFYNEYLVDGENIFMNDGGKADFKYYYGKASYSDHVISFKSKNKSINLNYLYYLLYSQKNKIDYKLFEGGAGLKNLNKKDFLNFNIWICNIKEQIKIKNLFNNLDNLINDLTYKIKLIKRKKNYFLSNLFI